MTSSDEYTRRVEDAQQLGARLRRMAIALALAEELLADTLENGADQQRTGPGSARLRSFRARELAEECRRFAARLETLL